MIMTMNFNHKENWGTLKKLDISRQNSETRYGEIYFLVRDLLLFMTWSVAKHLSQSQNLELGHVWKLQPV